MASYTSNARFYHHHHPLIRITPPPSRLESLPVEMIYEIMRSMGARDLSRFVLASKTLFGIFKEHQASIMCEVLRQQPEFAIMLCMYTMVPRDFQPGQMLFPRSVKFDPKAVGGNYPYDRSVVIDLLEQQQQQQHNDDDHHHHLLLLSDDRPAAVVVETGKFLLQTWDLLRLWKLAKVVDWWVEMYPSLRWRDRHQDHHRHQAAAAAANADFLNRRCLRPREEARLRVAIARWWLYAHHFHGSPPSHRRRDLYQPHKWRDDRRLHHIRLMSTREICELEDLWSLVYEVVSRDLCSSPERIRTQRGYIVELVPWGSDEGRHAKIVNTYLKLDPQELKGFLDGFYIRKKWDIIRVVRDTTREFNLDGETLSVAITTVLEERMMLKPKGVTNVPRSGIVDEDRDVIQIDDIWGNDASPNGRPPLTQEQINAYPREYDKRLPYGDDGSDEPY